MNIEDFEKQYVASVVLNEGDKILLTEDNIEPLRKILKQSNFHWFIDHEPVAKGSDFQPNRILILDNDETCYAQLEEIEDFEMEEYEDAINYVFVDF